jgi:hypothetical protein
MSLVALVHLEPRSGSALEVAGGSPVSSTAASDDQHVNLALKVEQLFKPDHVYRQGVKIISFLSSP